MKLMVELSGYVEQIHVQNADRKCMERACGKEATCYASIIIDDVEFYIPMCDEHAEHYTEYMDKKFRESLKGEKHE
jgi:hypothetical protein